MEKNFVHGYALLTWSRLCAYPDNEQYLRLLHHEGTTQQAILNSFELLKVKRSLIKE
ncbi:hypothetical protein XM38_013200 [Halomicronema hongdechloris C2206]|uniref:Uncharacterized protein n=1 Tax=Halomicronema hongdechloris C2206 TaxID=1641165 RepID=A0A1Z3HJ93_9CYAN|nr:hypothetical protein XM38_013200 [Halomicronema hongdechloris C2206]